MTATFEACHFFINIVITYIIFCYVQDMAEINKCLLHFKGQVGPESLCMIEMTRTQNGPRSTLVATI